MTVDPQKPAEFIAALRKKAEEASARNPVLADLRHLGKSLIEVVRTRLANGQQATLLGGYLSSDGQFLVLEPTGSIKPGSDSELISKLRQLACEHHIRAAAVSKLVDKAFPSSQTKRFVQSRTVFP